MQMKNVNLVQNSESSVGPPLPPRASSQLSRPLPGPPSSVPNNLHGLLDDPSHIYSPYKSVPVPKPIPPPYRQPPFPNPQYGTVGHRLNNDPLVSMPGSADTDNAPDSPVYVTHSSKFPIKQPEAPRPQSASLAESSKTQQPRIPHLAEVVRQQSRPRTANTVMPDPGPQPLTHQAWSEEDRSGKDAQVKRTPFREHPFEATSNSILVDGHGEDDEGERLLVHSRSRPSYPMGIDNQSLESEEHGYVPSQPHQRLEGARGQVLMERRPNPIPLVPKDAAPIYRAHFVTTEEPIVVPQRGHLRDTCSRLYGTSGSQAIHHSMQNLKGSTLSLHSATGRLQFSCGPENPYVTKEEVLATSEPVQQSHSEAHSGTVPPPRQFRSTAINIDDSDHTVDSPVESRVPDRDESVRSAYEPSGSGPQHRYYHLKDMTSGPCEDNNVKNPEVVEDAVKSGNDNVKENGSSSKTTSIMASEDEEGVYGAVKRGAIRGVLHQQLQQSSTQSVRDIAQRFQQNLIEAGKEQQKPEAMTVTADDTGNAPNDRVSVPTSNAQLPLSPSAISTSSESGRGTMPIKSGGSPISGGTLNTSFESDAGGRNRIPSTGTTGGNTDYDVEKRSSQMAAKSLASTATTVPQPSVRQQYSGNAKWTDTAEKELRQILDAKMQKPRSGGGVDCVSARRSDRHSVHDTTFSDSFSITPPLPPLSPLDTPPSLHSRNSKYKLSLSSGNLHKSSGMTPDILETTRRGPTQNSKEFNSRLLNKKVASSKSKSISGSQDHLRTWTAKKYAPPQSRVPLTSGKNSSLYGSRLRGSEISLGAVVSHDGEVTSTTTGLDMDSLLDDGDLSTDDGSSETSRAECGSEMNNIRQQLEGLEAMYSEVMRALGVKGAQPNSLAGQRSLHDLRPSRRRVFGSLTSLTGKVGRSTTGGPAKERTGQHHDRKKIRDSKSVGRRFQRLESHVVTLARSVAHLSSEMRTQHIMFQELESLRQEVAQLHEQHGLTRGGGGGGKFPHHGGGGGGGGGGLHHHGGVGGGNVGVAGRAWDNFRSTIPSLTNPARIKKLTKFFGDEPPLLRLFLKKLGYEKYAPQFEAERIGIVELPYLTEERLQKIGIPMGPRMRILQEAQMSFRQEHFNIYIV